MTLNYYKSIANRIVVKNSYSSSNPNTKEKITYFSLYSGDLHFRCIIKNLTTNSGKMQFRKYKVDEKAMSKRAFLTKLTNSLSIN